MSTRSTASLFAAAREDAPTPDARDAMWSRISEASTVTTAAAGAATLATKSAAPAGGVFGTKLVVLGGVIGAAGAVLGVVLTLLVVSSDGAPASSTKTPSQRMAAATATGARLAEPAARKLDTASLETVTERGTPGPTAMAAPAPAPDDPSSDLSMEAKLVTDARAALLRGEADLALSLVKRTHRLGTRALEPEELGLESRALRSLGRIDEAAAIDLLLKRRFPDSALAR